MGSFFQFQLRGTTLSIELHRDESCLTTKVKTSFSKSVHLDNPAIRLTLYFYNFLVCYVVEVVPEICEQLRTHLRTTHPEVFYEKSVLKNFAKFTGKHLYRSLLLNKVAGRPLRILKYSFFTFLLLIIILLLHEDHFIILSKKIAPTSKYCYKYF